MINPERPVTLQEAQSFAQAMGQLAGEKGKGYIVREGHTYRHVSLGEGESTSSLGKMNARDVVSTAKRVAEFAKANITVAGEGLTGEELKNIEAGMAKLKNRITQHKKSFTQMFVNFAKIANILQQGESFKTQLENAIKERPAPKLNANDNASIIDKFLNGVGDKSLEECKRDKLNDKFKEENADLINKFKDYLDEDVAADRIVDSLLGKHNEIGSAKKVDQALIDSTKQKLSDHLRTICTRNKKLSDLERNSDFNRAIQKYREISPRSDKSPIEIVKELTKIDLIDKPMNRLSPLVSQSTPTHVALLAQMMDKIDPGRKPQEFKDYTMTTGGGYFIDQQKGTDNLDRKEGETTLSHMFHLIDHLDTNPSDDPNVVKLQEDLKRSLPFAFEAGVIAAKEENQIRGRDLEGDAEKLSGKIYEALSKMNEGERLFLPMGCEGHGTLLMMTKTSEGEVEVQHINTGYQLEAHTNLLGVKGNLVTAFKSLGDRYPIGVKANIQFGPQRQGEIKSSIAGLIRVANGKKTNMKDATEHFRRLAGKERGFKPSILRRDQQAQNCSYRCFLEGIREVVGVDSYRGVKIGLIDRIEEDYSKIPGTTQKDEFITKLETIKGKTIEARSKPKPVKKSSEKSKTVRENIKPENKAQQGKSVSSSRVASSSKSSKSEKTAASAVSSSATKPGLFKRMMPRTKKT